MQETWKAMEPYVDKERFSRIAERLSIQKNDAVWWKDACLLYFQTFSKMKLPKGIRKPEHKLKDLMKVKGNSYQTIIDSYRIHTALSGR